MRIGLKHNPVNISDSKQGVEHNPPPTPSQEGNNKDLNEMIENMTDSTGAACTFDNLDSVRDMLLDLKEADLLDRIDDHKPLASLLGIANSGLDCRRAMFNNIIGDETNRQLGLSLHDGDKITVTHRR